MPEYIIKWNPDPGSTMIGKIKDINDKDRLLIVRDHNGATWSIERTANIAYRLLSSYANVGDTIHLRRVEYKFRSGYYIDLEVEEQKP